LGEGESRDAALITPWGDAADLRARRLHPSAGTPRAEVIANQRRRLFGAIFAAVAAKGYEASTVADVVELSGVSRSAFYQHFSNKAECLAAAAAELVEPTLDELRGAASGEDALGRFLGLIERQPDAARVCLIELRAAGAPGEEVARRAAVALSEVLAGFGAEGKGPGPDPALAPILVDGLAKLIETRLRRGEQRQLAAIAPQLWGWLERVASPPQPLARPRERLEERAPFQGYTPAERIARAVAAVLAERSYLEMSTDDIAARAQISLSTFYANFADKHDAVLAALEISGAQLTALAGPAARRAGGWQLGVRALFEAICAYFAAEPDVARMATSGIYGAGPRALSLRDRVIDSLAAMLAPGFEENPGAPALSGEAAAAVTYAMIAEQVRRDPARLGAVVPGATYLTLVGFVGPERAAAVANAELGR
jgi:AcrR family transcriptional regulator